MKKLRTLELAEQFYQKAQGIELKNPMKNQFERALLSVVLNIAEGSAKPYLKDRKKFYYTALGSLREVQALLSITGHRSLLTDSDSLGAALYCLARSTRR